jgi:hypothetical protein
VVLLGKVRGSTCANGVCRQAEFDSGNCNRLIESDDESSSGTNGGEYY